MENGFLKQVLENEDSTQKNLQLMVPLKRVPDMLRLLHDGVSDGHEYERHYGLV